MSKGDLAHIKTDEEIAKIEKLITKEYKKAHKEVSDKLDDYLKRFAAKDAKWQEWVLTGAKTEAEYKEWRKGQMLVGKRWEDLKDTLAQDLTNAAKISQSIAKEYAPEVYAINHNYATFQIEKKSLMDTSYSLYSRESVEYMYKGKPKLYHTYGKAVAKEIKEGKQYAWDRRRITSVLTQAIIQGESIPKITKRLEQVTVGDHKSAIRNARTMMTGVQNAGRIDAMKRAKGIGIPVRKQWLATTDARTRHWHRELDGEIVDENKPFENAVGKIMFPGDPSADAANVFNCRCTLLPAIEGFELDVTDPNIRPNEKLGEMTYDEWRKSKKSISLPIDLQEKKGQAIQGAWWGKYGGGAGGQSKYTVAEAKEIIKKYEEEGLSKQYSGIWANKVVTPSDYPNMKKQIVDKKWQIDKQIAKAEGNGDLDALAKYKAQKDLILDFEEQGKKWLAANPEKQAVSKASSKKAVSANKTKKVAQKADNGPVKAPEPTPSSPVSASGKQYSGIWTNKTVVPEDYPNMKKAVNDKKWQLNKQIEKAEAKGDMKAVAKYQKQLDELLDFEKEGQKFVGPGKVKKSAVKSPKATKDVDATKVTKTAEKANKGANKATPTPKPKKVSEKQALKDMEEAQKKMDAVPKKSFSNIWQDPVSVEDYADKKDAIAAKRKYFEEKFDEAMDNKWAAKADKFEQLLMDLDEFEKLGKEYEAAKKEYEAAKKTYKPFIEKKNAKVQAKIDALTKDVEALGKDEYDLGGTSWFFTGKHKVSEYPGIQKEVTKAKKKLKDDIDFYTNYVPDANKLYEAQAKLRIIEEYEEAGKKYKKLDKSLQTARSKIIDLDNRGGGTGAYSDARKAKALWAKNNAEYRKLDDIYDKHARTVHASKTAAEHEGYYHYTWGSGPFNRPLAGFRGSWSPSDFVGPGKVNIDASGYGDKIRGLTRLCEKSKQPQDFWVQTGQTYETLEGMLGLPYGSLGRMSDAELQQFVGAQKEIPQFISGAINKGGGSYTPGNMLFNIYCPKGSEALYVLEDGMYRKSEHEMILQRGGTYRITRIYRGKDTTTGSNKLIVDMELRLEEGYNKFQQ